MAIPLPKYKQQVRVSGKGVAQTIDPSATIRAAGAGDELMAKIVTDAGGIASDYFNKKAEVQDKATLTRITQEQNNLLSNIEQQKQDALFGRGDYEGNALSINELYEKVTKPELDKFQNKINQIQFNFNENKQKVDASVNNYLQQINTRELVELNRIEIEQYNFDRLQGAFDLEYKTGILQDELDILKKDPVANADQIKKHEEKINANKIAYEEDFKDLERTTKPNVIKEKRSTFAYNALAGQVRQTQLDFKADDIDINQYREQMFKYQQSIKDNKFMSANLKQTLENEIISKINAGNIKFSRDVLATEVLIQRSINSEDGFTPETLQKIELTFGKKLSDILIKEVITVETVGSLAGANYGKIKELTERFTEANDPQAFEEYVVAVGKELPPKAAGIAVKLGAVLLTEMLEENPTLSAEKVFLTPSPSTFGGFSTEKRKKLFIPYNGQAKQLLDDILDKGEKMPFKTDKERKNWEQFTESATLSLIEMFLSTEEPPTQEMIEDWKNKWSIPSSVQMAENTSVSTPMLKSITEDEENQRFLDSLGLE